MICQSKMLHEILLLKIIHTSTGYSKKSQVLLPKNIAPLITLKQKKRNSNFHTIPFFSTRSKRLRYPQLIFIQIKHTFHQLPFFSRRTQTRTVLKFRHILFPLSLPRKIRQFIHKVQWSFYNHKKL